ncbi:MAG TPA: hypothetical protein VNH11_07375 [Pirellulales bacterium]|nr:hypothetical protein [Pirellulales bacterium]
MQTWAAFIGINENYQEYLDAGGSSSGEFGRLMREILDASERADEVAQSDEQMQLLSIATELPLLENWRKMVRGPFVETLPWWLDGTLERTAAGHAAQRRPLSELLLMTKRDAAAAQPEHRLAASSHDSRLAVAEAKHLRQTERPVAGDRSVTVRFWRDRDTNGCKRWRLELIGGMDEMKEYVSAEIDFGGAGTRAASFSLGVATFELGPGDLDAEVSATLVTARGERQYVLLNESPNGGH